MSSVQEFESSPSAANAMPAPQYMGAVQCGGGG
jgi:hypothetical protein